MRRSELEEPGHQLGARELAQIRHDRRAQIAGFFGNWYCTIAVPEHRGAGDALDAKRRWHAAEENRLAFGPAHGGMLRERAHTFALRPAAVLLDEGLSLAA